MHPEPVPTSQMNNLVLWDPMIGHLNDGFSVRSWTQNAWLNGEIVFSLFFFNDIGDGFSIGSPLDKPLMFVSSFHQRFVEVHVSGFETTEGRGP